MYYGSQFNKLSKLDVKKQVCMTFEISTTCVLLTDERNDMSSYYDAVGFEIS